MTRKVSILPPKITSIIVTGNFDDPPCPTLPSRSQMPVHLVNHQYAPFIVAKDPFNVAGIEITLVRGWVFRFFPCSGLKVLDLRFLPCSRFMAKSSIVSLNYLVLFLSRPLFIAPPTNSPNYNIAWKNRRTKT